MNWRNTTSSDTPGLASSGNSPVSAPDLHQPACTSPFFSRMRVFLCVHACYLLDSNRVIYIGRESASLFSSSHACINNIADDGMPTLASLCHTRDSSLLSNRVMREDQNPTQPLSSRRVLKNIWVISHLYRSKFQSKKTHGGVITFA